jgi:hypothetical protein
MEVDMLNRKTLDPLTNCVNPSQPCQQTLAYPPCMRLLSWWVPMYAVILGAKLARLDCSPSAERWAAATKSHSVTGRSSVMHSHKRIAMDFLLSAYEPEMLLGAGRLKVLSAV